MILLSPARNRAARKGHQWALAVALLAATVMPVPQLHAQSPTGNAQAPNQLYLPLAMDENTGEELSAEVTAESAEATLAYWTEERMASATIYVPVPVEGEPSAEEVAAAEEAMHAEAMAPASPPEVFAAGRPHPMADQEAAADFPDAWQALPAEAEAAGIGADGQTMSLDASPGLSFAPDAAEGTANLYTGYRGNYYGNFWQQYPYRTIGKLYFRSASGANSVCTAAVITSRNVIVTAAQCMYDTVYNRWHSNWVFVPADRAGSQPFGRFPYLTGRINTAYINASGPSSGGAYNVGLLKLGTNSSGRSVTYYTGWLGRYVNTGYVASITEIGYGYAGVSGTNYTRIQHAESRYTGRPEQFDYGNGAGLSYGAPIIIRFAPYDTVTGSNNGVIGVAVDGYNYNHRGVRLNYTNYTYPCSLLVC